MKTIFSKGTEVLKSESTKLQKYKGLKSINLKTIPFLLFYIFYSVHSFAQTQVLDSTQITPLNEVLVAAVRVTTKTPVSFSNMTKKEISYRNLGQDIPILMNYMPSVVTTSDAGNGIGYTGIRVRGSDATRVNVTINGIPYNDSESQGTFWVNMPDFASSVQSLQLQRGVGTSTNGSSAFGASLNMLTDDYSKNVKGEISSSAGSFGTLKNTVKFSTGILNKNFELAGRVSSLKSDGYIDRASSNLKSYFLQGTYVGETTLIKALAFGGTEKTYQAWNGVDKYTLTQDRTFNTAGMYTDEFGNPRFYDNEIDNYQQDHYQLHWSENWSNQWSSNIALHYTKGKGFYENYKENAKMLEYNLIPISSINTTDLVRRKWLDNDFYGTTFSLNYKTDKLDGIFGGALNNYKGDHYGTIVWARFASQSEPGDFYYQDYSTKGEGNIFTKANYQLNQKWSFYGDLQYRYIHYQANSWETGNVDDTYNFFNPKAGLNYSFNLKNTLYFSYARANREPNRVDYEFGNPKPEKLNDYELGWRLVLQKLQITANLYLMAYKDQLILTGRLDDVGNPIRANSEKSYRTGLEVDATIVVSDKFTIRPNFTLSSNKNVDLAVDGYYFGTTDIAYSPQVIAGNVFVYRPIQGLYIALLQKYVGEQYMNNIELPAAKLADYFVNDLNATYEVKTNSVFKSIVFSGLVNNIFNKKYVSNGSMWDVYPYYYPQAGTNFLLGLTLNM